jgi:hypothetical protein
VTQDEQPLLFAADVPLPAVNVYDALSGKFLRKIEQLGYTPTALQPPWRP